MKATITVTGTQTMDGDRAEIRQQAVGMVRETDGVYRIVYTADEMKTTVTVEPSQITVSRVGTYSSVLILEMGQAHTCLYRTPYGMFDLTVTANRIENELVDGLGRLYLSYELDMGGAATKNEIEITVKEVSA